MRKGRRLTPEGANGIVYGGTCVLRQVLGGVPIESTVDVAIKTLQIFTDLGLYGLEVGDDGYMHVVSEFVDEAKVMARMHHKNIVHLHGLIIGSHGYPEYLIMERGHASLDSLLKKLKRSPDTLGSVPVVNVLHMARDILSGLHYMHEKHVVHFDLKPGNVLITIASDGSILLKLCDLGTTHTTSTFRRLQAETDVATTPYYRCPEKGVSTKVDMYAFGIMMAEIVVEQACIVGPPVDDAGRPLPPITMEDLFGAGAMVNKDILRTRARDRLSAVCPELGEVIMKTTETDPILRWGAGECLHAVNNALKRLDALPEEASIGWC